MPGAFSISLTVKDLAVSRSFYETLGFEAFAGDPAQGWQMMRNRDAVIGLFQGMFDKNMLTFNPGWTAAGQTDQSPFEDVRDLQARLKAAGITLASETDPDGHGPASIMLEDPDGNPILIDQHVDAPTR